VIDDDAGHRTLQLADVRDPRVSLVMGCQLYLALTARGDVSGDVVIFTRPPEFSGTILEVSFAAVDAEYFMPFSEDVIDEHTRGSRDDQLAIACPNGNGRRSSVKRNQGKAVLGHPLELNFREQVLGIVDASDHHCSTSGSARLYIV